MSRALGLTLLSLTLALVLVPFARPAQPLRVALVVGNSAYTTPEWRLKNPARDAELIGSSLESLGFSAQLLLNATNKQLAEALENFGRRIRTGGEEVEAVFFYAGHAAQDERRINFLVPVDATSISDSSLSAQAQQLQRLFIEMAAARNKVNIIILDACRDIPVASGSAPRRGPVGLSEFAETPRDSLVAYSTKAGRTAPDGAQENSLFTRELANALANEADKPVVALFADIGGKISQQSNGAQTPEFLFGLNRAPAWSFARRPPSPIVQASGATQDGTKLQSVLEEALRVEVAAKDAAARAFLEERAAEQLTGVSVSGSEYDNDGGYYGQTQNGKPHGLGIRVEIILVMGLPTERATEAGIWINGRLAIGVERGYGGDPYYDRLHPFTRAGTFDGEELFGFASNFFGRFYGRNGFGVVLKLGDRYEGEYDSMGSPSGFGRLVRDGKLQQGFWRDGKLVREIR